MKLLAKILFLIFWSILFALAITKYPGSNIYFVLFSLTFLVMLMSGFYRQVSYGYLFLVIMLWLGFWFKIIIHLLVDYQFAEPVGGFDNSSISWDEVLKIGTIGSLSVLLARILYGLAGNYSSIVAHIGVFKPQEWFSRCRNWIWALAVLICVGLAFINSSLGVLQIGLVQRTILIWPLNAIISLLIGYGLCIFVGMLIWWDIALNRKISFVVGLFLFSAFISSLSLLSRGAYLFQTVPVLLALYKNKGLLLGWSRKNTIAISALFFLLFVIANLLVNTQRDMYYSNINTNTNTNSFLKFAVDRWVGIEGVMAISSYPEKSGNLIMRSFAEKRVLGSYSFYEEISQSHYRFMDTKKFQFASIPGVIGFFYLSGDWWVVAIGLTVFTLALLVTELLVFRITNNLLVSALWGGMMSNMISQFGVAPFDSMIYLFHMSFVVAAVYFFQSTFFTGFMQKIISFYTRIRKAW